MLFPRRGRNRFGILVLNVEVGAVHQTPRSRCADTISYSAYVALTSPYRKYHPKGLPASTAGTAVGPAFAEATAGKLMGETPMLLTGKMPVPLTGKMPMLLTGETPMLRFSYTSSGEFVGLGQEEFPAPEVQRRQLIGLDVPANVLAGVLPVDTLDF